MIWDRFIMSESSKFMTLVEDNYSELDDEWLMSEEQEAQENQRQTYVMDIVRVQYPTIPTDGNAWIGPTLCGVNPSQGRVYFQQRDRIYKPGYKSQCDI